MARKSRRFTAEFKKRVALEALRERDTVQAIASRYEVHPNQVGAWKQQAVESLDEVFPGDEIWISVYDRDLDADDLYGSAALRISG